MRGGRALWLGCGGIRNVSVTKTVFSLAWFCLAVGRNRASCSPTILRELTETAGEGRQSCAVEQLVCSRWESRQTDLDDS